MMHARPTCVPAIAEKESVEDGCLGVLRILSLLVFEGNDNHVSAIKADSRRTAEFL